MRYPRKFVAIWLIIITWCTVWMIIDLFLSNFFFYYAFRVLPIAIAIHFMESGLRRERDYKQGNALIEEILKND